MPTKLAVLGLVLCVAGCSHAPPKNEKVVHSIHIDGAKQVPEGEIKDKLLTSETSWIPFSSKQYFDPENWKTDLKRIERYYREQGYYQAKVVASEVKPHGDEVDVHARVEEGEPTLIGEVRLEGIDDLPDNQKRELQKQVLLQPGQVFREDAFEGLKQKLLQTLEEQGFASGKVEGEAQVGLDTHKAQVVIHIVHGPRFHFGEVSVKQREPYRVDAWRISERAAAAMPESDWYSLEGQNEAQRKVFQMGVFGAVKVRPLPADPLTLKVPMEVQTQEAPFHTLRIGGGVAFDQTRQQANVFGQYIDRDWLGGLRQLTLKGTVGWAWIPSSWAANSNGPVGDISAELQQPRFYFRDLSADVKLEAERGLEPAYAYWGTQAKFGLIWQPTPFLSIYPSYNFEFYRLTTGVAQLGGTAPTLLFSCPENCLLSYLEERIEWDHRDDKQEPHRGYFLSLAFQQGGGFLGGSFDYYRIEPEARGYFSLLEGDRLTFAFRAKAGTLLARSGQESPIVARFYSGGNDMRGFGARYLSPLALVSSDPSQTEGYYVPVGGDGLVEGSVEARYRVTGPLVVATFFDTGAVTVDELHATGVNSFWHQLQYAFGLGLRYLTPIGPIRFDFAYRPNIGPALPVQVLTNLPPPAPTGCFGLGKGRSGSGGAPEGQCTIQLSIGEAF